MTKLKEILKYIETLKDKESYNASKLELLVIEAN